MTLTANLGSAKAAETLVDLRRSGKRRDFAPGELAGSISEAYAVAARTVALEGRPVVAWKLGGVTAGMRAAFGAEDVVFGAICEGETGVAGDSGVPVPPFFQSEAEIVLRLARDVATAADLARTDGLFDAWAYALEAPYSPVANLPAAGLASLLSDRCATGALYMTQAFAMADAPAENVPLQIVQDSNVLAQGDIATGLLMPPRDAAIRFLELALAEGLSCTAGQWISTGGVTPCVPLQRDCAVSLRFGGQTVLTVTPDGDSAALR